MSEDLLTQCVAVIEDLLQRRPAQRSYRVGRQLIHAIRSKEAMAAKAAQKKHAAELATKRMRAKLASPEAQEANDWAGEYPPECPTKDCLLGEGHPGDHRWPEAPPELPPCSDPDCVLDSGHPGHHLAIEQLRAKPAKKTSRKKASKKR